MWDRRERAFVRDQGEQIGDEAYESYFNMKWPAAIREAHIPLASW